MNQNGMFNGGMFEARSCIVEPWPYSTHTYPWSPVTPNDWNTPKTRNVKRTTRTIEKYNEKGKLISKEVITEEEEIIPIQDQIWYEIVSDSTDLSFNDNGAVETTGGDPVPDTFTVSCFQN